MMVNGKYHYICIVSREWSVFDLEDLELLIFKSMRDHFCENRQIKGTVTSIERTTTKTEYWNLKLWLKKVSDRRPHPDSKTYFWMLINWQPKPEQFSAMCLTPLCYVPMEWRSYSTPYLRHLVFEAARKQWKACKHIEGTTILLGGVTAKLQYYHFDIWLRKDGNPDNFPRKEKYFRLRTKCIVCATAL